MSQRQARDHWLAYTIGIAALILIAGFVFAWFYLQQVEKRSAEVRYLNLSEIAIARDGHSIRASFAVRTSGADADWAAGNRQVLEQVMKQALMDVDPKRALAPDGLKALQHGLRDASNDALQSAKVQEVLVTDFLVSEADY